MSSLESELADAGVDVVDAEDPQYEQLRPNYNKCLTTRPGLIAFPHDSAAAAAVVTGCVDRGIPFRVRSGGHCYESWSMAADDGVLIDLRRLDSIELGPPSDAVTRVSIGAGARAGDVQQLLQHRHATLPVGLCPDVGIGGLTLGGGIGALSRRFGLTADRVEGMEVVLASGEIVDADRDLLWALRGAGSGNFGLVTRIVFDAVPVSEVLVYVISWRAQDTRHVLEAWQRWAPDAPVQLASASARAYGGDRGVAMSGVIVTSGDEQWASAEAEGHAILESFLRAAAPRQPVSMELKAMSCVEATRRLWEGAPDLLSFKHKTAWLSQPLPAPAIDGIVDALEAAPDREFDTVHVVLFAMGGVLAGIPSSLGAFPYRDQRYLIELCSWWDPNHPESARVDWTRALNDTIGSGHFVGGYLNSADDDYLDPEQRYYGRSLPRLKEIKRKYDPRNVFRHPGSVQP